MSIWKTHQRKRSMNHSTKGQASTAIQTGSGNDRSQSVILSPHLVGAVNWAICSPWASTATRVTTVL